MEPEKDNRGAFHPAKLQERRALLSTGEAVRLVIMLLVLVICIYYIGKLSGGSTGEGERTVRVPWVTFELKPELIPGDGEGRPREFDPGFLPEPRPPVVPPFQEDPSKLLSIQDDSEGLDEAGFYHLVHQVASMTQEELDARATEAIDRRDFWFKPGSLRGRFVKVRGTLYQHYPWLLDTRPNESGHDLVYRGLVVDHANRPMQFLVLEKDREYFEGKTLVEVSGVFYKLLNFETARTGVVGHQPVIIARRLVPYQPPTREELYPKPLGWSVLIVVVLSIGIGSTYVLRRRRAEREFERKFRERHPLKVDNQSLRGQVNPVWRKAKAEGVAPQPSGPPASLPPPAASGPPAESPPGPAAP